MKVSETAIPGLLIIEPKVWEDPRGYFFESFHQQRYAEHGINEGFIQDNQSKSQKGVLRGLHYQNPPFAQGKLVQVIAGAVLDVAVDIRKESPTYGQHVSIELSGRDKKQFWIPTGFAHGFVTLEDDTIFSYKCTNVYHPESEGGIMWNDPDLNIDWKITDPQVSNRDLDHPLFRDLNSLF